MTFMSSHFIPLKERAEKLSHRSSVLNTLKNKHDFTVNWVLVQGVSLAFFLFWSDIGNFFKNTSVWLICLCHLNFLGLSEKLHLIHCIHLVLMTNAAYPSCLRINLKIISWIAYSSPGRRDRKGGREINTHVFLMWSSWIHYANIL